MNKEIQLANAVQDFIWPIRCSVLFQFQSNDDERELCGDETSDEMYYGISDRLNGVLGRPCDTYGIHNDYRPPKRLMCVNSDN